MNDQERYMLWINTDGGIEADDEVLRAPSLAEAAERIRAHGGRKFAINAHRGDASTTCELVDVEKRVAVLAATVPNTADSARWRRRSSPMTIGTWNGGANGAAVN